MSIKTYNINYSSDELTNRYSNYRFQWDEFYLSERKILSQIGFKKTDSVLDLGCACGGLGHVLKQKYDVSNYTGIDISKKSIDRGKLNLVHGDVLDKKFDHYTDKFNKVISFSCIDWNVQVNEMFDRAWSFVKSNGHLIVSVRLTDKNTINDAYQIIGTDKPIFTVWNFNDFNNRILSMNASTVCSYGYWSKIKENTYNCYEDIFYCVYGLQK